GVGHVEGCLDPISTAALIQALDRVEPLDSSNRTLSQRRADALMRLAHGGHPPRTVIDVTVDIDTLAGRHPSDLTSVVCEVKGSGPVSPAMAQVLACDAA